MHTVELYSKTFNFDLKVLKQLILLIRPFHIIHQLVIVLLVIGLKQINVTPTEFISAWLMLFLLMPFLFGLNDYWHRVEDKEMGRDRLFTSNSFSKTQVLTFTLSIFLVMNYLAFSRSMITGLFLYLMIICGLLYGYFKHKKQMIKTYSFRTLSGVTFYLVVASYFGLTGVDFLIALFVGLLDLYSHIAGDLRDYQKDKVGKVNTFPVRFGTKYTLFLILGVYLLSVLYLSEIELLQGKLIEFLSMLPYILTFPVISFMGYFLLTLHTIRYNWLHAIFHFSKIATYSFLGLCWLGISLNLVLGLVVLILIAWLVSYYLYLWGDNRI